MIRIGMLVSTVCITIMCGLWYWLAREMPADATSVPVHWGLNGAPDRFVSGADAILGFGLLPVSGAILAIVLALAPLLDPFRDNLRRSARGYLIAWAGGMIALTAVAAGSVPAMLAAGAGETGASLSLFAGEWPARIMLAVTAMFILLLGDALPKTRKNFFIGVRTPWTLTSDLAWEKTHRLTGRLFVLTGLWGLVAAFWLKGMAAALALGVPMIASVLIAVVYSFLVWRRDPERQISASELSAPER